MKTDWGGEDLPENPGATLRRLADQINFFDKRSQQNQKRYKWLKGITLFAAAAVTVSAAFKLPMWVVPVLGALIVLIESFLKMNSNHENWLGYRRTCESLVREKYLFLGMAGPYREEKNPEALLAERIEGILSQDHEAWLGIQQEQSKKVQKVSGEEA